MYLNVRFIFVLLLYEIVKERRPKLEKKIQTKQNKNTNQNQANKNYEYTFELAIAQQKYRDPSRRHTQTQHLFESKKKTEVFQIVINNSFFLCVRRSTSAWQ